MKCMRCWLAALVLSSFALLLGGCATVPRLFEGSLLQLIPADSALVLGVPAGNPGLRLAASGLFESELAPVLARSRYIILAERQTAQSYEQHIVLEGDFSPIVLSFALPQKDGWQQTAMGESRVYYRPGIALMLAAPGTVYGIVSSDAPGALARSVASIQSGSPLPVPADAILAGDGFLHLSRLEQLFSHGFEVPRQLEAFRDVQLQFRYSVSDDGRLTSSGSMQAAGESAARALNASLRLLAPAIAENDGLPDIQRSGKEVRMNNFTLRPSVVEEWLNSLLEDFR